MAKNVGVGGALEVVHEKDHKNNKDYTLSEEFTYIQIDDAYTYDTTTDHSTNTFTPTAMGSTTSRKHIMKSQDKKGSSRSVAGSVQNLSNCGFTIMGLPYLLDKWYNDATR